MSGRPCLRPLGSAYLAGCTRDLTLPVQRLQHGFHRRTWPPARSGGEPPHRVFRCARRVRASRRGLPVRRARRSSPP
jgi:hypothetical protein